MQTSAQSTIHIIGLGNLGKLVAPALASAHPAPPQVTILLHRPELNVYTGASVTSLLMLIKDGVPGNIDEVTDAVSHGVYKSGPFFVVHAGMGNVILGVGRQLHGQEHASAGPRSAVGPSQYLLNSLPTVPVLSASVVAPANLLQVQLEKLAIDAVINPLTVTFDCLNGEIFNRPPIRAMIRALLAEVSAVLRSLITPSTTGSQLRG